MTENVIDITDIVRIDDRNDEIYLTLFDIQQAVESYLLENGQITNGDEVMGMSVTTTHHASDEFPGISITVKREREANESE
jgi:riboflavin synthase alpha subunit